MGISSKAGEHAITRLNANGRIVIPAHIRVKMGLKPGEAVIMTVEEGILRIEPHVSRIRKIQDEFRKFAKPRILASDELIVERRKDAWREKETGRG